MEEQNKAASYKKRQASRRTSLQRIMVAGGGTGGHLFPGIAVVEELQKRLPELDVVYVGTERGIEARVIPARGDRLETIQVTPLKGRSKTELVKSVFRLPTAVVRAVGLLRKEKPNLVLGVGGYASGPVLAAASLLGIPSAILEQNAHVGLTNRVLGAMAGLGRAYITFPQTAEHFSESQVRVVGNPVRREFVDAARRAVSDSKGFESRCHTVLVLGGSQGAKSLNTMLPEVLAALNLEARGLRVVHQTGKAMQSDVEAAYKKLSQNSLGKDHVQKDHVQVVSFIDDMAAAYSSAVLVIARAGATTLAELCAVGRPSVLIPYPQAADDHQGKNAEALEEVGAARCLREETLDKATLRSTLEALLNNKTERLAMADAARACGNPEAAATIVDDIFEWFGTDEQVRQVRQNHTGVSDDSDNARSPSNTNTSTDTNTNVHAADKTNKNTTKLLGAQTTVTDVCAMITTPNLRGDGGYVPQYAISASATPRTMTNRTVTNKRPLMVGGSLWE